ncbi:hypothetical protein SAMN05192529_102121 [Arachidicoccus rhizosphaerae]|uniref:Uncharacterized protein n=1 Tax=Arachidicoccus rhizosphaerae TaxID=551991 RepID=A0A1H3W6C0_9BACT|nr:hypothetical protein SAMN05192529_102121 [Arachidicoccus rhizosphaerae]
MGEFRDDTDFLDTDFGELTGVTWADSDIDEYDQEYIHEDEVNKLRSLVQAQKELIGFLDISIVRGFLLEESLKKVKELRNQIKELEK